MSLFRPFDPFQDALEQETQAVKVMIDIRYFEHSKKRKTTTAEGFPKSFDLKGLVKKLMPILSTGGVVIKSDQGYNVAKFQGDFRQEIRQYLIDNNIVSESNIRLH